MSVDQQITSNLGVKTLSIQLDYHIAVVATNTAGQSETGFGTLETCKAFFEALRERYSNVSFHEITTRASLNAVVHANPDLVVLCSKYLLEPNSRTQTWFSKFFQDHKIAHTGSIRAALEFDSNKAKAKATVCKAPFVSTTLSYSLRHRRSHV